jgi:hypothetical protein
MIARSGLFAAALAAVGAMAGGMGEARADIIASGVFTSDHCTGGCLTGQANGGTVTVTDHQNGTLDFNILLSNGNLFVGSGFDASIGFNLVGNPSITYSGITPAAGWTIPGGPQSAGVLHMDGTGNFEYGLDVAKNGFGNNTGSSLKFSIAAQGLDINDFEVNALGQFFAADIYSGTTGNTGAVDLSAGLKINQQCTGTCDPTVPEPASLAIFGVGLLGLGFVTAKRRK